MGLKWSGEEINPTDYFRPYSPLHSVAKAF